MNWPLIAVVGPTASGKSALSLKLAQAYEGEIIAADSRTIYRGMDIGTAKPTAEERKLVRHYLLDVVEPGEPFTVAQFKQLALQAMDAIHDRKNLPILAGGTGLYVDSVLYDYQFPVSDNAPRDNGLLALGVAELQQRATELGVSLNNSDWHNPRRLVRAIETKGAPRSKKSLRPNTLVLGINLSREVLQQRIQQRVTDMVQSGLVQEVEGLAQRYGADSEAMTGIGYRSFALAALGQKTVEQATEETVAATIQLAKRQMTWFRRSSDIVWVDDVAQAMKLADQFLAKAV